MTGMFVHTFGLRYHFRLKAGFDLFSFIDIAAKLGFSGVNASAHGPDYSELGGSIGQRHLDAIRAHLERHGLGIDLECRGTDPERLRPLLAAAARVGASGLRTYTVGTSGSEQRIAATIADLKTAAADAERFGVEILLENHEDQVGVDVACILREVDNPFVRALYDYGNSMVFQEDPLTALDAMAPWIRTAHLKDHVLLPGTTSGRPLILGVPLGTGYLPIMDITRRLIAVGARRICYENCWGYHTALREPLDPALRETGVFRFAHFRPEDVDAFPYTSTMAQIEPQRLLALEARSFMNSYWWLRRAFCEQRNVWRAAFDPNIPDQVKDMGDLLSLEPRPAVASELRA